jgi:hypothetical protein
VDRVNGTDSLFDANIEVDQTSVLDICRLVQWVVSRNPSVGLVVLFCVSSVESYANKTLTSARCSQILTVRSWKSLWSQTRMFVSHHYKRMGRHSHKAWWFPASACQSMFCPPGAACRSMTV